MKQDVNILLLFVICLIVCCCAKTPSRAEAMSANSAELEKSIDDDYPFVTDQADSLVIKLCRYDHVQEHDSLMARYVFDYFYELIWEETGVAEMASYKYGAKDSILSIIAKAPTQGLVPPMFRGKEYHSYLETETPVDDQNIVAKIEIYYQEQRVINVLWCSRHYIDGMEEFNKKKKKIMPKAIIAEFDNIHKSAKN